MKVLQLTSFALLASVLSGCDGGISVTAGVVDPDNNPIAGAAATMRSSQVSREYSSVTTNDGCLSIGGTATPGRHDYLLSISAPGYKRLDFPVQTLEHYNLQVVLEPSSSARASNANPTPGSRCGAL